MRGAKHLTRATQLEVFFGNEKAVIALSHHPKPFFAVSRQRRLVKQNAVTLFRAAAYPSPQLMQLRQAKPLWVLNDHQARVGHIHPHFDYRRCYKQVDFSGLKARHHLCLFRRLHAPVYEPNPHLRQLLRELLGSNFGRLTLKHFAFIDEGAHPVGLTLVFAGCGNTHHNLVAALV